MPTLSVVVITKNEAHNIEACLQSVDWADEIIVLDSGSDDDTVALARHYTDKVFVTDWPGFGLQKQRALEKTQGDWGLSIDAEEEVSLWFGREGSPRRKSGLQNTDGVRRTERRHLHANAHGADRAEQGKARRDDAAEPLVVEADQELEDDRAIKLAFAFGAGGVTSRMR